MVMMERGERREARIATRIESNARNWPTLFFCFAVSSKFNKQSSGQLVEMFGLKTLIIWKILGLLVICIECLLIWKLRFVKLIKWFCLHRKYLLFSVFWSEPFFVPSLDSLSPLPCHCLHFVFCLWPLMEMAFISKVGKNALKPPSLFFTSLSLRSFRFPFYSFFLYYFENEYNLKSRVLSEKEKFPP